MKYWAFFEGKSELNIALAITRIFDWLGVMGGGFLGIGQCRILCIS